MAEHKRLQTQVERILTQRLRISFGTSQEVWILPATAILHASNDDADLALQSSAATLAFLVQDLAERLGEEVTDDDIRDTLLEYASELDWEDLCGHATRLTSAGDDDDTAIWNYDDWAGADFPMVEWVGPDGKRAL